MPLSFVSTYPTGCTLSNSYFVSRPATTCVTTSGRLRLRKRPRAGRRRHELRPHNVPVCSSVSSSVPSTTSEDAAGEGDITTTTGSTSLRIIRYGVFMSMATTYAFYVGLRSTFPFAAPTMGLGLGKIGVVSSAFPVTYGLSRLFTGALVDNGSPKGVLLGGLALAGLSVAAMALSPIQAAPLSVLWGLCGMVQGAGASCSAKLLTAWFAPEERGRWWSLWATSANAGAFGAPLLVAFLSVSYGARFALAASGLAAVCVAALGLPILRNSPQEYGYKVKWAVEKDAVVDIIPREKEAAGSNNNNNTPRGFWDTLRNEVLNNRALWALAAANASIYLIRSGLKNWLHFFLIATRSVSPAAAAVQASVAELGGVAGTFGAGVISDLAGGRRVLVTVGYLCLLAVALLALAFAPVGSKLADAAIIGAVGFAVNGPQMMIGLIGAEVVDPKVLASAAGLLGAISYGGAAIAGYPLSRIVQQFGWIPFFSVLSAAAIAAALLLTPFRSLNAGDMQKK